MDFYDERRRKNFRNSKLIFLNKTYTRRHLQVNGFKFSIEWMAMGSQHKS